MKNLIITLLVVNSFISQAQERSCPNVTRAVNTDQEDMAIGTAVYKYKIAPKDILAVSLTDYLSWKEKQQNCLADIRHTAVVNIQFNREVNQTSEICDLKVDVNRFDHFLTPSTLTTYSFSNEQLNCRQETTLELTDRLSCKSQPCQQLTAERMYRDYKDNCSCKSIWDFPEFTDHSENYKDFYNPTKFFKTN